MALLLIVAIAVLPFTSNHSYQARDGELFSLAQEDTSQAQASDAVNLGNSQVSSNTTTFTMSSGQPPDPRQQTIFTQTFRVNLPYQMDTRFSFAGSSPSLNFTQESARVSIRMVNGTHVIQQSYSVGRSQERLMVFGPDLYYDMGLPNSTRFTFTRNITSDLRGEGLAPSTHWTIIWVGFGFIRYPTIPSTTLALFVERNSTVLHSDMINPVRFSLDYSSSLFFPLILVSGVASVALVANLWLEAKWRKPVSAGDS